MIVEGAGKRFEWVDGWAQLDAPEAWPHSAVVVNAAGEIVTCDPDGGALLFLDRAGRPIRTVPVDLGEAHGITLVIEDGAEHLWLADAASRKDPAASYSSEKMRPAVVKVDRSGSTLVALELPFHPLYADGPYKPRGLQWTKAASGATVPSGSRTATARASFTGTARKVSTSAP